MSICRLALLLRQEIVHNINTGSHWASSLVFSLVCELVSASGQEEAAECVQRYNALTRRVEELGLDKAVDANLILNVRISGFTTPGLGLNCHRAKQSPAPWMKGLVRG
jgi:tRNA nucleotidyltransferase (CCA-adding enzyme)